MRCYNPTRHVTIEYYLCCLCLSNSKQKYRLFEAKACGEDVYTELGGKLRASTEMAVPSHIKTVCKTCRDSIIQVRKMQLNVQQRVNDLKMMVHQ